MMDGWMDGWMDGPIYPSIHPSIKKLIILFLRVLKISTCYIFQLFKGTVA